ncbi:hypothetical protein [Salmonella enterica]|uniref:Uncharacterized protein n=1 Tax=Salmonella enterica TaxID=28901 RepID=A0A8F1A407_SALER|nr:hypothetical protein [Salmonella enterica]EKF0425038.1 hypothetical protein [Salmonella enterica subsp. enterica]OHI10030.1 hypothetical protein A7S11_16120 [Salmonella enterica]OHI14483.1 hypothetical protein A7S13_18510 [Salmonella enterica]OHI19277.1 hypothetical protein A7S14_17440 [Salmonella enterica]OHI24723.1 hypothetical protein A7S15_14900 [Salmonella enterica]
MSKDYLLPNDELEKIYSSITSEIDGIYEFTKIIMDASKIEGVFKDRSILFFDCVSEFLNSLEESKIKNKMYVSCVFVYFMLKAHGYSEYAHHVLAAIMTALSTDGLIEKHTEIYIKNEKVTARKGKVNRHHDSALKIAMSTWAKYPNASLAGMTEEIHAYLRSKWNDTPTTETIKSWLKKSNLYPDAKPKNRDFKLIINEEG